MAGGRPTDYKPEYCELVKSLGKLGKSVVEMANACEVTKVTLYEWEKEHEEFSYAFQLARQFSQEWWESTGQNHLVEKEGVGKINAGLYSKSMAARFPDDWREKVAVGGDKDAPPINVDVTDRTLNNVAFLMRKAMEEGKI